MNLNQLEENIISKKTFLCLGLDTDIDKIPKHLLAKDDPVFQFNKLLVDRLSKKIAAVKINTAFMRLGELMAGILLKKRLSILEIINLIYLQ